MSKEFRILPCEAAKLLNKSNLFVYEAMKRFDENGKRVLDIGAVIQMPNSKKLNYSISPAKLAEYLGVDIPTLYERLADIRGGEEQTGRE